MKDNRGKPSKAYRESLRRMSEKDYIQLEKAVIQAIVNDQTCCIIIASHLTKFPEDFPHRRTIEKAGKLVHYQVNARKVLKWLNDKGYSGITSEMIRVIRKKFTDGTMLPQIE